jgi:hypothetical protein
MSVPQGAIEIVSNVFYYASVPEGSSIEKVRSEGQTESEKH